MTPPGYDFLDSIKITYHVSPHLGNIRYTSKKLSQVFFATVPDSTDGTEDTDPTIIGTERKTS